MDSRHDQSTDDDRDEGPPALTESDIAAMLAEGPVDPDETVPLNLVLAEIRAAAERIRQRRAVAEQKSTPPPGPLPQGEGEVERRSPLPLREGVGGGVWRHRNRSS